MASPTLKRPSSNPEPPAGVGHAPAPPRTRPSPVLIEDLFPEIDGGRYPVKRCPGDAVRASATIFRDGHDRLQAAVRFRAPGASRWHEAPMSRVDAHLDGDRWSGEFTVTEVGRWSWQILAWTDHFASWQEELERKRRGGQESLDSELAEGAALLEQARSRAKGAERETIAAALAVLGDQSADPQARLRAGLREELLEACRRWPEREDAARSAVLEVEVERERARFGSWYELFPRSWGGFEGVREQLGELSELGFDVLYLPPVHPIGVLHRKGRNDSLEAGPEDPGSPWAIGAAAGGHTAVHPDLGSLEDFERLVEEAREHGMEIALDFAAHCSADHPWLKEHPEWFRKRPDGTLKYAENPPKRYMDIYNFDWDCEQWRSLWEALRDAMLFWVGRGVKTFRVDNPHTKPLAFWEWLLASVRTVEPEAIFLSEAFTRSAMMNGLAKAGFSQSYTYFTWKNSSWELREYMQELARAPQSEYLRPNLFTNTPDILSEYLQHGGPGAFAARLLLAATLSPSYGIYSGFESFESEPRHQGSEEYLDSEKYQLRPRSLDGPLLGMVARLNEIRRAHTALQRLENIVFLPVENEALLAYLKRDREETLIVVVNLDPRNIQEGIVVVPGELGLGPVFTVEDLLDDERHDWRLGRNYVRLDPSERAGHLLLIREA
jgi:starch synthase (maltosyl-transferring)